MKITVSMFENAFGGTPADADLESIIKAVAEGKWRERISAGRKLWEAWHAVNPALDSNASPEARAYGEFKKTLPAFCVSGTAENRKKAIQHSNLIQIDFDKCNGDLESLRDSLKLDAHILFGYISPSGDGLKAGMMIDGTRHLESFLSAQAYFLQRYNRKIDASVKDPLRLCFVSHDPEAWMHPSAEVLPVDEKLVFKKAPAAAPPSGNGYTPVSSRAEIAAGLLAKVVWEDDQTGYCECPGISRHTGPNNPKDCRITLGVVGENHKPPTIHCFHNSCRVVVESMNHRLRSDVGKAEYVKTERYVPAPSSQRAAVTEGYLPAEEESAPEDEFSQAQAKPTAEKESERLIALMASRQFNFGIIPPRPPTRYWLKETAICTAGNLTAISAAVKSGKSSVLTAMMASAMVVNPEGLDFLGFQSSNPEGHALIHIDTEQSREDHDDLVRRAIRRAGLSEPPPWLYSFCLTGLSVKDLQAMLWMLMETSFTVHRGIHSVLIDGVADMVADVNEPEACNAFIAESHGKCILYKCPIIGIIHLNPGTEKSRGHLGSQLERKAETNLRMERDGDTETIVLWADKTRRAPILKRNAPRFQWSDEAGMHVSCDYTPPAIHPGGRPSKIAQIVSMNTHDFLAKCLPEGEGKNEIARRLESWLATTKRMDLCFSQCKAAVTLLVESGKLSKTSDLMFVKGPNA